MPPARAPIPDKANASGSRRRRKLEKMQQKKMSTSEKPVMQIRSIKSLHVSFKIAFHASRPCRSFDPHNPSILRLIVRGTVAMNFGDIKSGADQRALRVVSVPMDFIATGAGRVLTERSHELTAGIIDPDIKRPRFIGEHHKFRGSRPQLKRIGIIAHGAVEVARRLPFR